MFSNWAVFSLGGLRNTAYYILSCQKVSITLSFIFHYDPSVLFATIPYRLSHFSSSCDATYTDLEINVFLNSAVPMQSTSLYYCYLYLDKHPLLLSYYPIP